MPVPTRTSLSWLRRHRRSADRGTGRPELRRAGGEDRMGRRPRNTPQYPATGSRDRLRGHPHPTGPGSRRRCGTPPWESPRAGPGTACIQLKPRPRGGRDPRGRRDGNLPARDGAFSTSTRPPRSEPGVRSTSASGRTAFPTHASPTLTVPSTRSRRPHERPGSTRSARLRRSSSATMLR